MKKIVCFLFALTVILTFVTTKKNICFADGLIDSGIDYTESLEPLYNPDRGMFYLYQIYVKDSATQGEILQGSKVGGRLTSPDFEKFLNRDYDYADGTTLFVLSFGLEYFSKKAGGKDIALTQNALDYIDNTLWEAQKAGVTVIVRFCYDLLGKTYDTKTDCEPEMSLILKHIEQLGSVLSKYSGIITAVQSGMFGPWGEQHTTTVSDYNNAENYYQMIEKWLDSTSDDMWILVRRSRFFVHWYNLKYSKNYTTETINQIKCLKGTREYRIGCYNDGYLADKTDWDTYVHRNEEIEWLSSQTYAPFGGEVCSDASGLNGYNNISYLEKEAFKTHTSFLNYLWDYDKVIKNWEKETYSGADEVYKGKTSSFVYVLNHLGYRLVLRESKLSSEVSENGNLSVSGTVENVGFGNVPREQNAYIVIVDASGKEVSSNLTDIDAQSFISGKKVAYSAIIPLKGLNQGEYKVYLRISGKNQSGDSLRYIAFANNAIYSADMHANYIGSFKVVKGQAQDSSDRSVTNSKSAETIEKSTVISSRLNGEEEVRSSKIQRPQKSSSSGVSSSEKKGCSSSADGQSAFLFFISLTGVVLFALKSKKNG